MRGIKRVKQFYKVEMVRVVEPENSMQHLEDLVRDVAAVLNKDSRIDAYVVESENFESIHNHSAYALIARDKITTG